MDKRIPYIPDINKNRNIQSVLHIMAEFLEIEPIKNEILSKKGSLLRHQIQGARMSILSNRSLKVHKPGTGKTCLQNAIIMFLMDRVKTYKHFSVYTLQSLLSSVKDQFLCKCTDGFYFDRNKKTGELEIGKTFKTKISIKTHNDLFSRMFRDKSKKHGKTVLEIQEEFQ